jgi:multidrug resistance efflux pump
VVDIEVGQAVTVTTDALSDITMEAVVTSISQSSYTQSGDMLYTVYIAVDDVDEPSDGA